MIQKTFPSSFTNLKLIPFVSSSCDENQTKIRPGKPLLCTNFDGKEASDFYKSVISSTASQQMKFSTTTNEPIQVKKSLSRNSFVCKNPSSILRYAQEGDLKGLKNCVASKCDINYQDLFGWTALMCASYEGHYECVAYLMQCHADVNLKSKQGMCAIDLAEKSKNSDILNLLKNECLSINHGKKQNSTNTGSNLRFCSSCKTSYKSSEDDHCKSIAHLLSIETPSGSTFYHIPESNKGFQLMLRSGWNKEKGLGSKADGRKFPIKTVLKKDRTCIGRKKEIAKVTHFSAMDISSVKLNKPKSAELMRERTLNKRERKRLELKTKQKEINFRRQFTCDF